MSAPIAGRPGVYIDQTPSERVARFIALQAGAEGSDLLRGGLTHTVVSAFWCSASRSRVMSTWEVTFLSAHGSQEGSAFQCKHDKAMTMRKVLFLWLRCWLFLSLARQPALLLVRGWRTTSSQVPTYLPIVSLLARPTFHHQLLRQAIQVFAFRCLQWRSNGFIPTVLS